MGEKMTTPAPFFLLCRFMYQTLLQYLIQQQQLWLQGVGHFKLMQLPARYDVANQLMMAPMVRVKIEKAPKEQNLQPLMVFLAKQMGTDEESAFDHYQEFCSEMATQLQEQVAVAWPGLGTLTKMGNEGNIKIDPALDAYLPSVVATRVIRQGSAHQMKVGETETTTAEMQTWLTQQDKVAEKSRWWIGALCIFLAAATLIVLKLTGNL